MKRLVAAALVLAAKVATTGAAAGAVSDRPAAGAPAAETAVSAHATAAVARVRHALTVSYSHRALRGVDWAKRCDDFASRLLAAPTADAFATVLAELVAPAQDVHLKVLVGEREVVGFRRRVFRNFDLGLLARTVPEWRRHNAKISTGRFPDGVGYLFVGDLIPGQDADLAPAFATFAAAQREGRGLVLDLRGCKGGGDPVAAKLAGCFVAEPVVFAKCERVADAGFSPPEERTLRPNPACPVRVPVAVLIGRGAISSAESFALMMRAVPGCVLVGDPTAGCSGDPRPLDLGNGVTLFVPSWRNLRPDGTCIEGEGVVPDVPVPVAARDFRETDPVLAAALARLRRR